MAFDATVLELLLAAPSDTKDELKCARNVIADWNGTHAKQNARILLPRYWETDTTPDFGNPPQAEIDRQIVDSADIVVAIFRHKFGPNTSYEIEKHTGSGKPALVYFFIGDVPQEHLGAAIELKDFKERCRRKNYYREYADLTELNTKLSRDLAMRIAAIISTKPSIPPDDAKQPELTYEAKVILYHASLGSDDEINVDTDSVVKTNGRYLNLDLKPREQAKWRNAVTILLDAHLIAPHRSGTTACFQLTDKGYKIADQIAKQNSAQFNRIGRSVEEEESRQAERAGDIAAQLHERMYGDGPEWRPLN